MARRGAVAGCAFWTGCALLAMLSLAPPSAWAFTPPEDVAGAVKVRIEGPATVTATEAPQPVAVVIENTGDTEARGTVRLGVVDAWRVEPAGAVDFVVKQKETARLAFTATAGAGTYNAHYPIHAFVHVESGGKTLEAHPILILQTDIPNPSRPQVSMPWQAHPVALDSCVPLWHAAIGRAGIQVFGEAATMMPAAWQGSDGRTKSYVAFDVGVDRGGVKQAVIMHPPWHQGLTGTAWVEFPLRLPGAGPLTLRFATAIRDTNTATKEPPSDGVTFRVRVAPMNAPDGELGEVLFERHSDAKTWEAGEADLTRFAGQEIRLQLESHPGPRNDTTCDQSFWGEPILEAGHPHPADEAPQGAARTLGEVACGGAKYAIDVTPGTRGLLNARVRFTSEGKSLEFLGFRVRVLGDALENPYTSHTLTAITEEPAGPGAMRIRHHFESWAGPFDVLGELAVQGAALKASWSLPTAPPPKPWQVVRIEDVSAGAWSAHAARVYAGVGNVIVEPEAFDLGFDGHQLSSSFVGFDFANAFSIVHAVDVPPNHLEVKPDRQIYTLHVPHEQVELFIPAPAVWEGVKAYRDLDPRKPAGGVATAAGRFVFDLWGGSYAEQRENLGKAFAYGLTDAMVVWHNWQRWGYDYRLPDIYPPNPDLGSLEEFRALIALCKERGVIFAPHDNYIDLYPDAEAYTFNNIAFVGDGTPIRAWLNEGRQAQSYRWRPDRVQPSIARNIALIREHLAPTGYFIDVWSSMGPHDYWNAEGQFFDRAFTRNTWGEAFAWIRDQLGQNAPQISESGHDQLIGWLDGAQCNHLRVDASEKSWCTWHIKCSEAERIPWLDMAHHDRFVLHGAGYSTRYEGGLDGALHGIYSDDYIASEVLTGHPAMVAWGFGRDVVRKYWLLHDLMRGLAARRIEEVAFEGSIHRQHVRWDEGTDVWVNRGAEDWNLSLGSETHVLPEFGFYAKAPAAEVAIERRDGVIVEWAKSVDQLFVNARPLTSGRLATSVALESLEYRGGRTADLVLRWSGCKPLQVDYTAFVHFVDEKGKIVFQADHRPDPPTTAWNGDVVTRAPVRIPEGCAAGQRYAIRVGLYQVGTGARALLRGSRGGDGYVGLGDIVLEGEGSSITGFKWTAPAPDHTYEQIMARCNEQEKAIRFGAATTNGAARIQRDGEGLVITPLPDSHAFETRIELGALPWPGQKIGTIEAISDSGAILEQGAARIENGVLTLTCAPDVFAYRLKP